MTKKLTLAYSQIAAFLKCRKAYEYHYIKRYDVVSANVPFLIGNCIHEGLHKIYAKDKDFIKSTLAYLEDYKQKLRESLSVSMQQEKEFIEFEQMIVGMLSSYAEKYKTIIDKTEHIVNEHEEFVDISDNVQILLKIDNILKRGDSSFVHEIKTTKYLTEDYVNAIKDNMQSSLYLHAFNSIKLKKEQLHGIIFDVIKKPSIRLKKNEAYEQYLNRLKKCYLADEMFYMEVIKYPLIKKEEMFETINEVAADIFRCKDSGVWFKNFNACSKQHRCEFYMICKHGENKLTMHNIKVRPTKEEREALAAQNEEKEQKEEAAKVHKKLIVSNTATKKSVKSRTKKGEK